MTTNMQAPLEYVSSIYADDGSAPKKPWMQRTFGKLEDGGLRGNIFLLTISTVGCTFFFSPYFAKQIGLGTIIILLAVPALISYYASSKLYTGFKHSQAKTYDEVMKTILGQKLGYLSNVAIFMHTFSSVLGAWVFSYKVLGNFLASVNLMSLDTLKLMPVKIGYFTTVMTVLFLSSMYVKVEKLKVVSMFGIGIILYMVIVFAILSPKYHAYYQKYDEYTFRWFQLSGNPLSIFYTMSEAYGICFFMYLNQYTIIPICNNIKRLTAKRMSKVIGRTTIFAFILFVIVAFIGYYSWPNYATSRYFEKLFVIRRAIPGANDCFIIAGKLLFALYLLIGMLVKGHFFLIYFNQMITNTLAIIRGKSNGPTNVPEMQPEPGMTNSELDADKSDLPLEIRIETLGDNNNETVRVESITPPSDSDNSGFRKNMTNLAFLAFVALLTICIADQLSVFLSIVGGFVAILEVVVFPLLMILAIDRKKKILGSAEKPLMIAASMFLMLLGFTASLITLYNNVKPIKVIE